MAKKLKVASRVDRWFASMIDSLTLLLALPAILIAPIINNRDVVVFIFFLMIAAAFALQAYLLSSAGQTIGKKIIGIRIVKLDTGRNGGFITNVLLRFIVGVFLPGAVFPIYPLIDAAFLFRDDKRAAHDLMAGTTVVEA